MIRYYLIRKINHIGGEVEHVPHTQYHTEVTASTVHKRAPNQGEPPHLASIDGALAQAGCSAVLQNLRTSLLREGPATCTGHLESATSLGLLELLPLHYEGCLHNRDQSALG